MSRFPDTPVTLLTRLSSQLTGEDEENWTRFFELYQPAMVAFVRARLEDNGAFDADDVVQSVLAKLVDVLRRGGYDRSKGSFRSYLAVMLRNTLFSFFRHEGSRPDGEADSLDEMPADDHNLRLSPEVFAHLEAEWAAARHAAALEHLLTKTALNVETKAVFRELEETGETCEAVARRHHLSAANVRQIKSRLTRMLAALEAQLN